jgi:hypothetical protein
MSVERLRLWIVLLLGFSVIGLEVVTFQTLCFVNDYLTATRVIGIALLGIAAGGVLSYPLHRYDERQVLRVVLSFLPISFLISLFAIARLNAMPMLLMAILTLPYMTASLGLSLFFNRLQPSKVYAYDLAGAGLGGLAVAIMVPWLREEGSTFLLAAIASVPLLLHERACVLEGETSAKWRTVGQSLAGLAILLLVLHIAIDPFNLLRIATVDAKEFPKKIFPNVQAPPDEADYELLYSRGSLIERIDIVKDLRTKRKRWSSIYNAQLVDYIDTPRAHEGWLDNRMPTLLRLGENPDTLLVGPSGQGLCKAVQALGKGHIDAVEINGAIAGVMTKEMYERSGRAYEGMDLHIGDVLTFLKRTERKYDFVTLLNTHRIWSMGHQGPPEYVHTLEAMRSYFSHLKPRGFVLFEERNINERADLGIRRIVYTAKAAMRELGIQDPSKHFIVWEVFHGCTKSRLESERCNRASRFTFLMVKRTPITPEEEAHLLDWAQKLGDRPDKGMGYRGLIYRYLPSKPDMHYWSDVVTNDDPYAAPGVDRAKHDLSVVRDDKPFPYEVFRGPGKAHEIVWQTSFLALAMVLIPAFLVFRSRRTDQPGGKTSITAGALTLFFAVLGIGYLMLELVLIQKLGIYLSSPAYTLAVVLSTMLIASGLGGYRSHNATLGRCLAAMACVVAYGAFIAFGIDTVVEATMGLPFLVRVLFAMLLIAPGAYAMGYPFPYAMAVAKARLSERHAGLYFGINGAVGAVATPLTLIASMSYGFRVTALIGAAMYAVCLVLLALTGKSEPPAAVQKAA